jgi:hypothetical protein
MYMQLNRLNSLSALCILPFALLLSGCLGGTVAQQIARSIATSVADNAVGKSVEAQEKEDQKNAVTMRSILVNPSPDPYRTAMLNNFEFGRVEAITEPLPNYSNTEDEIPIVILKTNPLVEVELYSLLIGDEKQAVLEKARLKGAQNLPEITEWKDWKVGTGAVKSDPQMANQIITFLIPPEIGKLPSGSLTMVELSSSGDVNIARY